MNVGKSLKVALAMKGMKQNELAEKTGMSRVWISRVANSTNASMKTIEKLSEGVGMKPVEFLALGED